MALTGGESWRMLGCPGAGSPKLREDCRKYSFDVIEVSSDDDRKSATLAIGSVIARSRTWQKGRDVHELVVLERSTHCRSRTSERWNHGSRFVGSRRSRLVCNRCALAPTTSLSLIRESTSNAPANRGQSKLAQDLGTRSSSTENTIASINVLPTS